ncbi:antitoxin [Streptomyces sp. NPDC005202]|uniref:antitoxin n=1 Tax=Streptomyces sp. NPDC005202 TaxID=3157021 RepID=UPI0033BFA8A8
MGIFDKIKDMAQGKSKHLSDAAEKKANEKTGNKYEDQVDDAQQDIEGRIGMDRDRRPDEP